MKEHTFRENIFLRRVCASFIAMMKRIMETPPSRRCGYRYVVMLFGCTANIISYTDRGVLSLAILPMEAELSYMNEQSQGTALAAFFCGYICTQLAGGLLSRRYGPKRVILTATLIWSAATLLTPGAARSSLALLFSARVVLGFGEGMLLPCLHDLVVAWVPSNERSTAAALSTSGQFVGQLVAMLVAPIVARRWDDAFYLFGTCGVVWCACFAALVTDLPSSTRCVGDAELARIRAGQRHQQNDAAGEGDHVRLRAADSSAALQAAVEKTDSVELSSIELAAAAPESCHSAATSSSKPTTAPPPRRWRRFFGNRALAAIYVAHWTHNWSWYLLLSWLPKLL